MIPHERLRQFLGGRQQIIIPDVFSLMRHHCRITITVMMAAVVIAMAVMLLHQIADSLTSTHGGGACLSSLTIGLIRKR